jgi:hypothetical protein
MRQNVSHVMGHGAHLTAGWDVMKFPKSVQKKLKRILPMALLTLLAPTRHLQF